MMAIQTRAPDTPKIATPFETPILPEIVAAVSDTTERMKELMQLRLAKHLPISMYVLASLTSLPRSPSTTLPSSSQYYFLYDILPALSSLTWNI